MPTKKRKSNTQKKTTKTAKRSMGQVIKLTLQLLFILILLTIIGVMIFFYARYGKTLLRLQAEAVDKVSASTEETFRSSQTSLVYDANGELLSTLKAEKDVYYLEYEEIPVDAVEAMLVSEDRKFFEHDGVDYLANIRAAIALIKHRGEITQGASTITQQLARAVFLSQEVTYERKIAEIFVAQELEKKYDKSEIMEYYLNEIYFANGHYGLQAAANAYFSEDVSVLSLSQLIFLCAIPNNPTIYNPLTNMENTLKRRDRILLQMYEEGSISEEEYKKAMNEVIELKQEKTKRNNYVETYVNYSAIRALMKAQGFVFRYQFESEEDETTYDEAYDELYYNCQKNLYNKGYRIYTSIDLEKQKLLQASVDKALEGFTEVNDEGVYQMQGAAVCIDNESGKVIAIVGGRDQELGGYTLNRAYQSFRQPGSSIKPLIVYTPAFERSYTPASTVVDEYIEDGPKNSGGSYAGAMTLQRAIELSKNTIAWKLFEELTPSVGLPYLLNMNFAKIKESDYVPAAALGGLTIGASPVEMAAAYATLENDGFYREPTCILSITDAEDNIIVGNELQAKQIYQTKATRIMTEVLTGVIIDGTAEGLGLTNTVSAGKTGTTNDKKDGWFVGYTPYYTTSVWVGYDMPKTVDDLKGSTYPGSIWHDFMEQIHTDNMTDEFQLYDWRADLEVLLEQEAIKQAEEEAALAEEQMQEDTSEGDITYFDDAPSTEEDSVNPEETEDLEEQEDQDLEEDTYDTDEYIEDPAEDSEYSEENDVDTSPEDTDLEDTLEETPVSDDPDTEESEEGGISDATDDSAEGEDLGEETTEEVPSEDNPDADEVIP